MQTQGIHTEHCRSQPPPTRMAPGQNWRARRSSQLVGPAQPKGQSLPGWWPAAPLSGVDGRGFCHQHPGRQLLSPPGRELFRGRRIGMWARCQVQPPLQCKRKVLSSQPESFVASPAGWNWPSPAGPKPGCLNPTFPSAVSLRIWVSSVGPERRGRQAGRQRGKILESSRLPTVCPWAGFCLLGAPISPS